jgi:predicted ATPase
LVEQGSVEEGVAAMRDALASYEGIGGQLYAPELHGLLAVGLGASGRIDEALEAADEALRIVETSQDHWWLPELHRLRGELALKLDAKKISEAEASLQEALSVARAQQAKSWELRAAMSLARLWHSNGEVPKARQLLEDTYGWFKEGFGTADLRASAMLLSDLNQKNVG